MKIHTIKIKNYKGIRECTIDLSSPKEPGSITTLIGLNESGKTTVLEAIARFISEDEDIASVFQSLFPKKPFTDLVPKDKKAAFTGRISIRATLQFEEADKDVVADKFLADGLVLDKSKLDRFSVERSFSFVDSEHKETNNYWDITFHCQKVKGSKKQKEYTHVGETRPTWLAGLKHVAPLFPKISYFPSFSFDFPTKIYLEEHTNETATNKYYRKIFQDILDAQGENLSIETHIVNRIKESRSAASNPITFIFDFFKTDAKSQVDAVMRKISNEMGKEIFGAWNQIFNRKPRNKQILLEWNIDSEKDNLIYVQIFIIDGQSQYALSERSLGFRWFFAFLLFTQFRAARKDTTGTIFLFDEPASNLHAKAQIQLLQSFPKIAKNSNHIMYSTHSHYMIEPLWLERAYIIDNKAVDYADETEDLDYFSARPTDIRAIKYRTFVGENPDKTTYFQPVLDRLQYAVSPLIGTRDCIVIEGKFDFHPMRYLLRAAGTPDKYDILPGTGAESFDVLVSLFVGWGRRFVILLDDDGAGRNARDRYLAEGVANARSIATLGDLVPSLKGKKFESLYSSDVKDAVKDALGLKTRPKKGQYNVFFQEKVAKAQYDLPLGDTGPLLSELLKAINLRFEEQT